jgi:predicted transposase
MKQVVQVKLLPTAEQAALLLRTMETFNAACNAAAEVAFRERIANKLRLQPLV